MKPVFASLFSHNGDGSNKGVAYLLASVVAGAVAALLLCPMESTRIKMVTDPAYAHDNLLTALGRTAATEGLGASFGGLWAMLSKQVPYTFGKQVSFDVFAGMLYTFFGVLQKQMSALSDGGVKWAVSVFAAMGASLVACILSQPGDMILTETYKPKKESVDEHDSMDDSVSIDGTLTDVSATSEDSDSVGAESVAGRTTPNVAGEADIAVATETAAAITTTVYPAEATAKPAFVTATPETAPKVSTAFTDIVTRLYREGGVAKFFTGTQARILHVGLIITSQLVIYDIVKQLLGLPATGSH